jgi:membrane protease YdiL (CAAX protease family)
MFVRPATTTSSTGRTAAFARRYQIPIFYALAFALSWLVWGSEIAEQRHLLPFALPDLLAYAGVGLAAFIAAGLADGRAGMLDLVRRMLRWRVGWNWYAAALAVPLAVTLASAGIYRLLGGDVALGRLVSTQDALVYFALALPVFLLSEEVAWRGFALPRLEARYSALAASLIVGVLWGIWHTPLFFMATAAQSNAPYLVFVFSTVAQSILFAWVYNNSGGSVLVVALLHTVTNTVMAYVGVGPGAVGCGRVLPDDRGDVGRRADRGDRGRPATPDARWEPRR